MIKMTMMMMMTMMLDDDDSYDDCDDVEYNKSNKIPGSSWKIGNSLGSGSVSMD